MCIERKNKCFMTSLFFYSFLITVDIQYYIFLLYNPVIRHYITCDNLDKSHTQLTPYIFITILLAIFLMLYFAFPWQFCNYQSILLISFTFSTHPHPPQPPSHLAIIKVFFLCICESVSVLLPHLVCYLGSIVDMYLLPFYYSYF